MILVALLVFPEPTEVLALGVLVVTEEMVPEEGGLVVIQDIVEEHEVPPTV